LSTFVPSSTYSPTPDTHPLSLHAALPIYADDAILVRGIISLAHSLHMTVVAEGVETAEQYEFLRSHQCDQVQGYYFSPGVTLEADRKSTRLNSSHVKSSYAVFCLKKKNSE